ncbi:AAA family ATPase [Desulfobacterales bacterium HSG2]|nr:AAA family ATPase [Desulfobacterales bacterium HSG2]
MPAFLVELTNVSIFSLAPPNAGKPEKLVTDPVVNETGTGVVQVLDSLKTGDREDLFDLIEKRVREFIPEIEKLSFIPGQEVKQLQVRESAFKESIPVADLSEGTQLAIIILTILYQVNKPSLICLEEIDRSLHPWLYGRIINLCMEMSDSKGMPQIIATTHNPYIVDHFKGHEEAVVIVEKKKGETTFETLAERLKRYEDEKGEFEDPLGELWYGGYVGGIPEAK